MSEEERRVYDNYLDTLVRDTDVMKTKLLEAEIKGEAKGEAKGRAKERLANAKALLGNGVPLDVIVKSLHLTDDEAAIAQGL